MFYAQSSPMLQMLISTTSNFVAEEKQLSVENTSECFSTMASVCRTMVEQPAYRSKFISSDTVMFCLHVMIGVIILYDHISPSGAFAKGSSIDVKGCVKVLKSECANQMESKNEGTSQTETLMNMLRYNSKHLSESSTPKAIKQIFS